MTTDGVTTTTFRWGSACDVGQVRQVNQDHVLTEDGLFAVADGMGGHRAGEVASEVAVGTLKERFDAPDADHLVVAVQLANSEVVRLARDNPDFRGMGTTISALALTRNDDHDVLAVANVGDSRTYLLKAESEELEQVTEDHSLVATLERQGQLTADEAASHPQRNILTRALGIDGNVLVDLWELEPVKGDRYLLCSDGLFNEVEESRIASVLRRLAAPDDAAAELVRLANEHGGRDNISVVIVDVVEAATDIGSAPGRVRRVTHGESRDGAPPEAVPARPGGGAATSRAGAGDAAPTGGDRATPPTGRATAATDGPKGPRSRFTWRVAAFLVALVAIVAGTYAAVTVSMNGTFYVDTVDGRVVIYRGTPGGLLWRQPEVVATTDVAADDVPDDKANDLGGAMTFTSRAEADAYVERLRDDIERIDAATGDGDPGEGGEVGDAGSGLGGALGGGTTTAPATTPGAAPADPAGATPPPSTTLVP